MEFIDRISWAVVLLGCVTLGLAPFAPPHVWEKLLMLSRGELRRAIDWFDLLMHGAPWLLLILKAVREIMKRQG